MAADTVEKIVRIEVEYKGAIKKLGEYRETLNAVKEAEKELKDAKKAGKVEATEYAEQQALLNQQFRVTSEAYRVVRPSSIALSRRASKSPLDGFATALTRAMASSKSLAVLSIFCVNSVMPRPPSSPVIMPPKDWNPAVISLIPLTAS